MREAGCARRLLRGQGSGRAGSAACQDAGSWTNTGLGPATGASGLFYEVQGWRSMLGKRLAASPTRAGSSTQAHGRGGEVLRRLLTWSLVMGPGPGAGGATNIALDRTTTRYDNTVAGICEKLDGTATRVWEGCIGGTESRRLSSLSAQVHPRRRLDRVFTVITQWCGALRPFMIQTGSHHPL